jgi:hypothetical protein
MFTFIAANRITIVLSFLQTSLDQFFCLCPSFFSFFSNIITLSDRYNCSAFTFLFIISCGFSALILGCIQNFDCRTIKFPQDNGTNGTSPGSFDSGPFTYRLSGVLNTVGANNSASVNEGYTAGENLWQICRSYKEINQDLNLGQLLSHNHSNTSYSSNSVHSEEDDVSIMTVQGMAISACILGS